MRNILNFLMLIYLPTAFLIFVVNDAHDVTLGRSAARGFGWPILLCVYVWREVVLTLREN